jgi:hypothetical protein
MREMERDEKGVNQGKRFTTKQTSMREIFEPLSESQGSQNSEFHRSRGAKNIA